jgi:hypothetical protein
MKLELTLGKKDLNEDIIQLYTENENREQCKDDFFKLVSDHISKDTDTVFLVWGEFDALDSEEPKITITEMSDCIAEVLLDNLNYNNFIKFNIFEFDSYEEALIYLKGLYGGRRLSYSPNTK